VRGKAPLVTNNAVTRVLVLGIGNSIMTDDGIGVKVAQALQSEYRFPPQVEVVDGGTLGLDLLPKFEGVSHLVMIDAVETGSKPGARVRLEGEELPIALETKVSPHQMGLKDLLAVAQLMGHAPGQMVLIGVQPASTEVGTELTPAVAAEFNAMKEAVLCELEQIGLPALAILAA